MAFDKKPKLYAKRAKTRKNVSTGKKEKGQDRFFVAMGDEKIQIIGSGLTDKTFSGNPNWWKELSDVFEGDSGKYCYFTSGSANLEELDY